MGILSTAIDNLSNLALQESGVEVPQMAPPALVDEFKAEIDMMDSLTEDEMRFPDYAVPVRECRRLGRYLIEMEDISRYMITNGVTSILEAVSNIGRANGVNLDSRNVALVVDESSILQEMDDLGMNIGSASNDGNIGTTGLLGAHTDIGKFRRFANSKEVVDTIANKYGLPLVKKNYNIGLINTKRGNEIVHNGNAAGNMPPEENMSTAPKDVSGISGNIHEDADLKAPANATVLNEPDNSSKSTSKTTNTLNNSEVSTQEDASMNYLRDIALGKYDDAILAEESGGELMRPVK